MSAARLLAETWPPVATRRIGPFTLRESGGGKRAEAATCDGVPTHDDLARAERAMDGAGRRALVSVAPDQRELDRMLAERGYLVLDPTLLLQGPTAPLAAHAPPPVSGFTVWPPLRVQRDIWAEGRIGPDRIAVMERVAVPRVSILGRGSDQPAGTCFVALSGRAVVVHALEIRAAHRRRGLGRQMMAHAARWGQDHGADRLSVLVTEANDPAIALYRGLGLQGGRCYHYRLRP